MKVWRRIIALTPYIENAKEEMNNAKEKIQRHSCICEAELCVTLLNKVLNRLCSNLLITSCKLSE